MVIWPPQSDNGLPSGEWHVLADLTMKETANPFKLLLDIPQT